MFLACSSNPLAVKFVVQLTDNHHKTGKSYPARYWYDGQYVNGAKEDAAEYACRELGIDSPSNGHTNSKANGYATTNGYSKGRVDAWGSR